MKFYGEIGFWDGDVEISQDVYRPNIVEKHYTGDINKNHYRFRPNNTQNEEFKINSTISIYADLYIRDNWPSIKYVKWNGTKWKVTEITPEYPKLTIQLGGVYNENES